MTAEAKKFRSWSPSSWRQVQALQQPEYRDEALLQRVLGELRALPPLVTSWEVRSLKDQLARAAAGRGFVLQGGDCAERFDECGADPIKNRLKILLQMSLVLVYGLRTPVVRIGRFAGQYAKPRSSDFETRDGLTLPAYRGDIVNGPAFTHEERQPDPLRLLEAYQRSALTLNFIRSLVEGGFADLRHPEYWDLGFVQHSPLAREYREMVDAIGDALSFVETFAEMPSSALERAPFFTSHEALLLHYEEAHTDPVPHQHGVFNLSTHFPWIGMRTAQPDGAHVEYCRGIANPVAVKVGPDMSVDWLRDLARILNPSNEPGRLTFIHRFGIDRIENCLPPLVEAVDAAGITALWICDPMHGNTELTPSGHKTRQFDNVLGELELAFDIHSSMGTNLGGVHFELTGEDVTECIGGARGLAEADLERAYRSHVDPRLNGEQALEMALSIVHKRRRSGT
jgi:3-deoxy-7-phosphoheptulonate synthase